VLALILPKGRTFAKREECFPTAAAGFSSDKRERRSEGWRGGRSLGWSASWLPFVVGSQK